MKDSIKEKLDVITWLDKGERTAGVSYFRVSDMLFWNAEWKKDEGLLEIFEFLLLHEKCLTRTSIFV